MLALLAVFLAGCSNNLNTNCEWPVQPVRGLVQDIELAEELSIRFADERWAPGPTRSEGRERECLAPLLQQIADRHGVSMGEVAAARARLADRGLNLAVNNPALAFFALVTFVILRGINNRFSFAEEPAAVAVAIVIGALLVGGLTGSFGRLWEGGLEVIRVGNGHLSYRGTRLPWTRDAMEYMGLSAGAFVVLATAYHAWRWRYPRTASTIKAPQAP